MTNRKFVGFQENVEIPENFELLDLREEIPCNLDRDRLFSLLSEPALLSKWFYKVISIDSKQSGKVILLTDSGEKAEAICTSFSLGEEIVLISNLFGEFSAKIVCKKKECSLHVCFKILTEKPDEIMKALNGYIKNLREIVAS
jgi:hypothetical protein